MFNDKPYLSVNREERFFCALFAHALLASSSSRKRICDILHRRLAEMAYREGVTLNLLVNLALKGFVDQGREEDVSTELGEPRPGRGGVDSEEQAAEPMPQTAAGKGLGMSKYAPLRSFLETIPTSEDAMSLAFAEIEHIIGLRLPRSAREHRPW